MIAQLWAWIKGYVIIKIKGANLEGVLNRIVAQGLILWDVQRVTANIIIAKMQVRSFKQLRPLLTGLNIQVSIVGRAGLPFLAAHVLKRKALLVGLLILCLGLYYLSGFIWFIEVTGNEQVHTDELVSAIVDQGIIVGVKKAALDLRRIENHLLTLFPQFSWVGINIRGVLIRIEVVERTSPNLEDVQYGNMVAKRDGLVTQILPFRGTPQVKVGDTVKKGEILISGEYYDLYGRKQRGAAEGVVRARVWYDAIGEAAYSKIVAERTGQEHVNYTLTIGQWTLRIGKQVPFAPYMVESHPWQLRVRSIELPVVVTRHVYYEVEYQTLEISPEIARSIALERAWQQLEAKGIKREQVVASQVEEYQIADQDGVRVGLIVELEENIAEFIPQL